MPLRILRALYAGLAGAAVMSVLLGLGRLAGVPVKLELLLGSMFTASVGYGSFLLGLTLHLLLGALFGLLHALLLTRVLRRADVWGGLLVGAGHAAVAGLLFGALPGVHPLIPWDPLVPQVLPRFGAFMHLLGPLAMALFVAAHLAFGAVVGAICRAAARRRGSRAEPQLESPAG